MLVGFQWSVNLGSSHWKTTKKSLLASDYGGPPHKRILTVMRPRSSGRRIAFSRVAEVPATSEICRDGPLPTQDISLVYQDGLEVVARKKVSQELPVQRSKRERFVKACNKLGILLNPRKRLVDAAVGPVLGGEFDGSHGHFCHQRKTRAEMLVKTIIFMDCLGWSVGAQHFAGLCGSAVSLRRTLLCCF